MSWRNPLKWGWFGSYDQAENETEGVSTKADPFAYRGGVLDEFRGRVTNLLKLSGNWVRKATGTHDEQAYIMIRVIGSGIDEEGAVYVAVRGRGREQSDERLFIGHAVIVSQVPIQAPAFIGRMTRFYDDQHKYCFNMQGDDPKGPKITAYDMHGTTDESKWTPTGQIYLNNLLGGK